MSFIPVFKFWIIFPLDLNPSLKFRSYCLKILLPSLKIQQSFQTFEKWKQVFRFAGFGIRGLFGRRLFFSICIEFFDVVFQKTFHGKIFETFEHVFVFMETFVSKVLIVLFSKQFRGLV